MAVGSRISALIVLSLCALASCRESKIPRGLDPGLATLYDPDKHFQCLDGSGTIVFSKVNDDYCDCGDGSDEPGTSACPRGVFYCSNSGFKPQLIPTSRVNDGICDCCDGSDEWDSPVVGARCSNTCQELGAKDREEKERLAAILDEGLKVRAEMVQDAKASRKRRKVELQEKAAEVEKAKQEVAEKERIKDEAEVPEKAALDVIKAEQERLKALKEEEERRVNESRMEEVFKQLDTDGDSLITREELRSDPRFDLNNDGIVNEDELDFFMAGHDSYDLESFKKDGYLLMKEAIEPRPDEDGEPPSVDGSEGGSKGGSEGGSEDGSEDEDYSNMEEDGERDEEEEDEEDMEYGPDGHLHHHEELHHDGEEHHRDSVPKVHPRKLFGRHGRRTPAKPKYDPETQKLVHAAAAARKEFQTASSKLHDLEATVKHLEELLSNDYGKDGEFTPLANECFEYADMEYTYKMCAFDYCSQKSNFGGAETRLGSWKAWSGRSDPYSEMMYDNGLQCWNGPQRSTRVEVICGAKNSILSVTEPNRCEYAFTFETPAICRKPEEAEEFMHDEL